VKSDITTVVQCHCRRHCCSMLKDQQLSVRWVSQQLQPNFAVERSDLMKGE